jgi:hypothetical protein
MHRALAIPDVWFSICACMHWRDAWAVLHVCKASRHGFLSDRSNRSRYWTWVEKLYVACTQFTGVPLAALLLRRNRAIDFDHCTYLSAQQMRISFSRAFFASSLMQSLLFPALRERLSLIPLAVRERLSFIIVPQISERNAAILTASIGATTFTFDISPEYALLFRELMVNYHVLPVSRSTLGGSPQLASHSYICWCNCKLSFVNHQRNSYPTLVMTSAFESPVDVDSASDAAQDFRDRVSLLTSTSYYSPECVPSSEQV